MNRWTGTGHLPKDPKFLETNGGTAICALRIAVTRAGKQGNDGYFDVKCFEGQAHACADYLKAGREVAIDGRLLVEEFQTPDGSYASHHLHLSLAATIQLRRDLIRQLAMSYDPDLVIVDKEPTGLRGELLPALDILRRRGSRLVLGVRDVLDEPAKVAEEWRQSPRGVVQHCRNSGRFQTVSRLHARSCD